MSTEDKIHHSKAHFSRLLVLKTFLLTSVLQPKTNAMASNTRYKNDRRKSNPCPEKPRRRPTKKSKTLHPNNDEEDDVSKSNSNNSNTHVANSDDRDENYEVAIDEITVETKPPALTIKGIKEKSEEMWLYEQIKEMVQRKLWRVCKFVTGSADRFKVTEKILSLLKYDTDSNPEAEAKWIEDNGRACNKAVNEIRGYSVGELKKKFHQYWVYNNKTLPPLLTLKACMNRTIDPKNPEEMLVWQFWVDKILDAACANKFDWNPSVRYYQTISHASDGEGNTLFNMLMNPSTEAWAMVCIENYYEAWPKHFEWKVNNPHSKLPVSKKNRILGEGEEAFPKQKWTDAHGGQQVYCGWHVDSLQLYNTYKESNTAARQLARSTTLEEKILETLKKDNGIVGDKPRKKKQSKADLKQIVDTLDF